MKQLNIEVMKIGITGATGQLGQLVVEQLKKRTSAESLVALVRTPSKAAELGIEAREFDYEKPENLAAALKGVDKLLLISGNEIGKRFEQHSNVINAAKAAGVKQFVYTSLLRADESSLSLAGEHLQTEKALKESGLNYTILRNGWYSENYTGSIGGALQAGAFIGSAGEGKISSASRVDYAEAAAVVLTSEGHDKTTYELSGDNYYTLADLAAEVSKQTGKNIPYNNLSETEYASVLKSVGLPEELAGAIAGWDSGASRNDLYDDGTQLSKLIGRPTTPIAEAVKQAL